MFERLGVYVAYATFRSWPSDSEFTGGKTGDLFLEPVNSTVHAAPYLQTELLHHGSHRPLNWNNRRLMLDSLGTNVVLKEAWLCTVGQSYNSHTSRRAWVLNVPG